MLKQPAKLGITSSGHYCVNIKDDSNQHKSEIHGKDDILTVTEHKKGKLKILLKLHKQFEHASVDRLKKLNTIIMMMNVSPFSKTF